MTTVLYDSCPQRHTHTHTFIICHLDYCNSLLYGMSNSLIQSVQNAAAARLVSCRNSALQTHYSSPIDTALASCSSKGGVQARMPSAPVVGWTNTDISSFRHSAHTADTGRPQLRSTSEMICVVPRVAHTTASVTKVSLLPVLVCATPCHHICGRT